ncbi:MAG TPA: DUF4148 domain-containing protein, partial [Burkholderiaceae bacterium]
KKSTLTRAAVQAEYLRAAKNNELALNGEGADIGYVASAGTSTLTRQDVKNEYLQAKRNDTLPEVGEGADIGYVASNSVLTRAEVQAEAVRAQREGLITAGE